MTLKRPDSVSLAAAALIAAGVAWTTCATPSFRADRNYPHLGLRLRALGNSEPEPLAPARAYTYTFTRGGESARRDFFDARELWYATQHAGQWRDDAGNMLIIGRPTRLLPAVPPVAGEHVSREAFEAALNADVAAFDPENAENLQAWIAAFAACALQPPEPLRALAFNLADALFFPAEDPALLIYAFRVRIRQVGAPAAPSGWYVAIVRIADGTPRARARKDFETQFLAHVAALPATAASGVQPRAIAAADPAAAAIPDHPSRIAARKSVENMRDWWIAETPDYIFLSNIRSAEGRALVRDLQTELPAMRAAFARLVPPYDDSAPDVSIVRIFEDRDAYRQYVGEAFEWSVGIWSSKRRELVILWQEHDREQTLDIIRHEAFHQYLFYATRQIEHAMWFNEGHACFVESARADSRGRVAIAENRRVTHLLQHLDAVAARIPDVLKADRAAFYGETDSIRHLNYTTAWALVYFLRKGAPALRLTAYDALFDAYLKALNATRDSAAATTAAFAGVDMSTLQEDFLSFWRRSRQAGRQHNLFPDP